MASDYRDLGCCFDQLIELVFVPMQIQDLAKSYQTKTDEELLQLAASSEQLTPEAHSALTSELARRRIDLTQGLEAHADEVEKVRTRGLSPPSHPGGVSEFVEEVLRVYGGQFWFFIKLVAPAVVVGYIAVRMGLNEGREIARQLLRVPVSEILRHRTDKLEDRRMELVRTMPEFAELVSEYDARMAKLRAELEAP